MNRTLVASLIAATASGCGGGASPVVAPTPVAVAPAPAPTPAPAPSPPPITSSPVQGIFNGTISSGRNFNGVILADGSLYGVYMAAGNTSLVGGLIQGTVATARGGPNLSPTVSSSNIKDFNAEGLGVRDASLAGIFEENLSFNGTITYSVTSTPALTFSTSTFGGSGATAITMLTGTYSGSFADSPSGRGNFSMVVDSSGAFTANASSGCRITGQFAPITLTNVFSATLSFGPTPCPFPTQVISGAAFYNASTRVLTGGAPSFDRSNAAVFILSK